MMSSRITSPRLKTEMATETVEVAEAAEDVGAVLAAKKAEGGEEAKEAEVVGAVSTARIQTPRLNSVCYLKNYKVSSPS